MWSRSASKSGLGSESMNAHNSSNGIDGDPAMDRTVGQIEPVPRVSIQAFCESPDIAAIVSAAIADRRMAKAHVKQNMGGAAAAVEAYKSAPTPNVVVLEAPASRESLLAQLEELAEYCDAGTKVVVLGKLNDIVLYRQLMARGVSEYLVAPFGVVDFIQAISQLFSVPGAKPLGRIIAVVGAKGGVGASTVAHNLAWGLASVTQMATIIADLDLAFGTAGLDYNQDPPQGVAEAVFAPDRVDAVLVDRLLSKCGDKLSLLAAPATLDRVLDFSEASFDSLIDAMRASTPWIVLDVPHLWSGWARRILVSADEVIVVASPDLANLRNAKNLIDNVKGARMNDAPSRLVLNGVGMLKRPEIASAEFAKAVETDPTAIIPHDAKLFGAAANNGQMIAEIEPNGKTAQAFVDLASTLAGRTEARKPKRGVLEPLIAKLGRKKK
jgi:pilus assembly protein CpaE